MGMKRILQELATRNHEVNLIVVTKLLYLPNEHKMHFISSYMNRKFPNRFSTLTCGLKAKNDVENIIVFCAFKCSTKRCTVLVFVLYQDIV